MARKVRIEHPRKLSSGSPKGKKFEYKTLILRHKKILRMRTARFFYPLFILFCHLGLITSSLAEEPVLRFPALNPDGTQVAFSWQGDIWIAPVAGGAARRMTVHEAYDSQPVWSPDSKHIAFISNRNGNGDLYLLSLEDGRTKRLTWHSAPDAAPHWSPDGREIWFLSRRDFVQVEREWEVWSIPVEGGTPQRRLDALGSHLAWSPDGRFLALEHGWCRREREAYRGSANRDIWLYDPKNDHYTSLTTFEGQDILPDWDEQNRIYYLSAVSGHYNLYRRTVSATGEASGPEALTSFDEDGPVYFDLSRNGRTAVLERLSGVFILDIPSRQLRPFQPELPQDERHYAEEYKSYTSKANALAVSPSGKYLAFGVRGELFVKLNDKEKNRSRRLTDSPARDDDPQWLNDSTLLFLSDRNGNSEIYLLNSADPQQFSLYKSLKRHIRKLSDTPQDEVGIWLSPNRKKLAVLQARYRLLIYEIDSKGKMSKPVVLYEGWAEPQDLAWSPDSRYLAYAQPDLDFNYEVYIQAVDGNSPPVNVSMHPRRDDSPVWSPDGSKLAFLSVRNHGDADIWYAWLRKSDWEKTQRDWEEEEEDESEKKNQGDSLLQIDFEGIHRRLVQLTRMPGSEGNLAISKDGKTFYFTSNTGGDFFSSNDKPALMKIRWDGKERKTLKSDLRLYGLQLGPEGKWLYAIKSGGTLLALNTSNDKQEPRPFKALLSIRHKEEYRQIFEEAWRALRDGFYDPDFHGRDWAALRQKYEPRALAASTWQDFKVIFNRMLGQVNASHMGLYGGETPEKIQREQTGLLGVELEPEEEGVRVKFVLPEGPADRTESRLQVGDLILAVNNQPVQAGENFYRLLLQTAGERVLLRIRDVSGTERELVIRPAKNLRNLQYEKWVEDRRAMTERLSQGRLGYLHIRAMGWSSFERFERELTAAGLGKEGIVIDVRFNGGGWTTDMLMTVLDVAQHAYTVPRGAAENLQRDHRKFREHYPFGERLPYAAWTKPSIALCNENSYSNAEIFSHAYKNLDLGTLVGTPTFGAVISTGGKGLLNGSYVRMPFRGWYVWATDENMEGNPAVPDVIVHNGLDERAKGQDSQLERAITLLLEQLDR